MAVNQIRSVTEQLGPKFEENKQVKQISFQKWKEMQGVIKYLQDETNRLRSVPRMKVGGDNKQDLDFLRRQLDLLQLQFYKQEKP